MQYNLIMLIKTKSDAMSNVKAINWNKYKYNFIKIFWDQNVRQFWVDEEIVLSDDKLTWSTLTNDEKTLYKHVLAGLTLLDTNQGSIGMPQIAIAIEDPHAKAVLSFMGFMEHMHAKSYSSIFSTLCFSNEIDELFHWVENHPLLQKKMNIINTYYQNIFSNESLYLAMSCSVFLETFLFYSGFFYPLYLAGQGKLVASGEIINLIIRDESIHGVFTGLLFQEHEQYFDQQQLANLHQQVMDIFHQLYEIEQQYIQEIYQSTNLVDEVTKFTQYNADKALMNLGMNTYFNIADNALNHVVIAGLNTKTKNHDFFSTKGNGYIKTTHVENITDDDFNF